MRILNRRDYIVGLLGATILIVFWLVVFTFPSFFLFNPLRQAGDLRKFQLVLSMIGWVGISTVVPLIMFLYALGKTKWRRFLLFFALAYPSSLVVLQFTFWTTNGYTYLSYLKNFPIFFITDLLIPILVIFIWRDLREVPKRGETK